MKTMCNAFEKVAFIFGHQTTQNNCNKIRNNVCNNICNRILQEVIRKLCYEKELLRQKNWHNVITILEYLQTIFCAIVFISPI